MFELDGQHYMLAPNGQMWMHPLSDVQFREWFEALDLHRRIDDLIGMDLTPEFGQSGQD